MKKLNLLKFNTLFGVLFLVATFAIVGCESTTGFDGGANNGEITTDDDEPLDKNETLFTTLVATAPAAFEADATTEASDLATQIAWASDSKISVYKSSGEWVDDFTVSDLAKSEFAPAKSETSLSSVTSYIAVYPARKSDAEATYADYLAAVNISSQAQSASTTDHITNYLQAVGRFKGGEELVFENANAIIEFTFLSEVGSLPEALTLAVDSKSYALTLSNMDSADALKDDYYTAYLTIAPVYSGAEMNFVVDYDDNGADLILSEETAMAYTSGNIYKYLITEVPIVGPQPITTVDELVAYLSAPEDDAVLAADIDLAGQSITPVYMNEVTFDGAGFKISNFTYESAGEAGLFAGMNKGAVIKNVILDSPVVKGVSYVGAFAAKIMPGAQIVDCEVINGDVSSTGNTAGGIAGQSKGEILNTKYSGKVSSTNGLNIGGIVGISEAGSVIGCSVDATVKVLKDISGGIAGKAAKSTISGCSFAGSITTNNKNIGGIVGLATGSTISDCHNEATVSAGNGTGAGIAANIDATTKIFNCLNEGVVTVSGSGSQGVMGGISATAKMGSIIAGCENRGNVTGRGYKTGGIIGLTEGYVIACINKGDVTVTDGTGNGFGGIAGQLGMKTPGGSTAVGCYNTGDIIVPTATNSNHAYIAGYVNAGAEAKVIDCFFIGEDEHSNKNGSTQCADIAALNAAVETMNTAIKESAYGSYIFVAGATDADYPTIILAE